MSLSIEQVFDLVKLVGLVVTGLWAAWTFQKLQKVRAAELENSQRLVEMRKSRIEQDEIRTRLLRQQPQLAIQLSITETPSVTGIPKSILCVTVTLKNEGEQNLQIAFDDSALTVARIDFEKNGRQVVSDLHRSDAEKPSDKASLRINAIEQVIFFATGKPGESGNAA
jgi:hypothetical protein